MLTSCQSHPQVVQSSLKVMYENDRHPKRHSDGQTGKMINLKGQIEHMLQNAVLMTEMGMNLTEQCVSGEKYVSYLRCLVVRAVKTMAAMKTTGKSFLTLAHRLALSVVSIIDNMPVADQACYNVKLEYEKLLTIIERELSIFEDAEASQESTTQFSGTSVNFSNLCEKIKYLEAKQKQSDNLLLPCSGSTKSVKSDVDEKYPGSTSRESLIDINKVVNLPTVPEDVYSNLIGKPTRTSSTSSLKGVRKVKLYLQRACNASDDEDESSELDEHEFSKISIGDTDDLKLSNTAHNPKKTLGNIIEETQD